jgi:hypothetical protein
MATLTPNRAKRLLRVASAVLMVGAVAAVAFSAALPLHLRERPVPRSSSRALPPLEQFACIWKADLRQSITPSTRAADTVDENAAIPIRLTGTLSPGGALIARSDGSVQAVSVGETVDGVQIMEVGAGQITVRYNGRLCRLSKPPEPNPLGGS